MHGLPIVMYGLPIVMPGLPIVMPGLTGHLNDAYLASSYRSPLTRQMLRNVCMAA